MSSCFVGIDGAFTVGIATAGRVVTPLLRGTEDELGTEEEGVRVGRRGAGTAAVGLPLGPIVVHALFCIGGVP